MKPVIFTDQQKQEIIADYQNGFGIGYFTKKYGVGKKSINSIINNAFVPRHPTPSTVNPIPKDIQTSIVNRYLQGETIVSLYKEYSTTLRRVKACLNKHNVPIRKFSEYHYRKYEINENFFDAIDTQEKAYILGYLYADGYNYESKRGFAIVLALKDVLMLEKFKVCIGYNGPLYVEYSKTKGTGKRHEQRGLRIANIHMAKKLKEHGCVKAKSFIIDFPNFLSDLLLPHFIRGFFDGDGTISCSEGKKNQFVFFCGSHKFLLGLKAALEKLANINVNIGRKSLTEKIFVLRSSRKDSIVKLSKLMYADSTICLQRKRDRFDKLELLFYALSAI